jgi:hypothetical protein
MSLNNDKEYQSLFKLNKITYLLNYVDIYYQKEILKDINNYTNHINQQLDHTYFYDNNQKKNKTFELLNKYLDTIIKEQIIYLIDAYHKENKHQILINSDKESLKITNKKMNQIKKESMIHNQVNSMKNDFTKSIDLPENKLNELIYQKINEFFKDIKYDLLNNIKEVVKDNQKFEDNEKLNIHIENKIENFVKIFLKQEDIYKNISNSLNYQIKNILEQSKQYEENQKNILLLIDKYYKNQNVKIEQLEENIFKKLNLTLEQKIRLLTEIFNKSIGSYLSTVSINELKENEILEKLESKLFKNNSSCFSKNNFQIKFSKEKNEIQLYYFDELISQTNLNMKGLIGLKGPHGSKGEKGDITVIRNIQLNEDETLKFILQNGIDVYEVNTDNRIPTGPRGIQGIKGDKGDPGNVNINLEWEQEKVMKLNKENSEHIQILKSLSIGENGNCLKNNSIVIGNGTTYKENSLALGYNSKTFDKNSIALFGNTLGSNAFSYKAEDVEENSVCFGSKKNNIFTIENITLKAKNINLEANEIKINNVYLSKIIELDEKINYLKEEINLLKK